MNTPPADDDPQPADEPLELQVTDEEAGTRLDAWLAARLANYSRAHLRAVIDLGAVTVDGAPQKPAHRLHRGARVQVLLPPLPREGPEPEEIPLSILYEDDDLAVVDKPPGMVVHPSRGHGRGTLAAALAWHFAQLSGAGGPSRPGIVHRLDRDTSGVIVVAKRDAAHLRIAEQFAARTVRKEYSAIVVGVPDRDRDQIDAPIAVHPQQREKMAVRAGHPTSRDAVTVYEVEERFARFALLRVMPRTGRTHQIRVHLRSAGYPVLCDRLYGSRARITRGELCGTPPDSGGDELLLERQALHARRIEFTHPTSGAPLHFEAPLPADMKAVLAALASGGAG